LFNEESLVMELNVLDQTDDVLHLELVGRVFDPRASMRDEPLQPALGAKGYGQRTLMSLAHTTTVNSMGLSWLTVSHRRFDEAGGRLVLYAVPPQVMETMMIMRLNALLELADDEVAGRKQLEGEKP
jgi:anti-anti-sigma regulatory factor